jgi:glycerol-3-phosphate dehydrogenase
VSVEQPTTDVDVVVIGGGVNGTGVARDATLRGLRVALLERNDIAFGASGNSSGMIHGGPRYLTKNPHVTYTSCLDSGHIQRVAPHLLFRVPFLVTVPRGPQSFAQLSTYDAFFEVYDRYRHLKSGKRHVRFDAAQMHELEPGLLPTGGGVSFDEWGIDGVRLCVASLTDAVERGAQAFIGSSMTGLRSLPGAERALVSFRRRDGSQGQLCARAVVNATGAWAPIVGALSGLPPEVVRLRPGKGVHVFLDRRLSNFAVITQAIDGREVFLLPWQNMSVLGTTDDDFYGDLDDVVATTDEVRYLLEAVARVFPAVRAARAIGTWAGVRPTLYAWGPSESQLSREHEIVDHGMHGAPGVYSMLGGKLASYRLFAEEMTDVLAKRLGARAPCQTHVLPLPGGEARADEALLSARYELSDLALRRLVNRHGARSERVLAGCVDRPADQRLVCDCEPVTAAEVRYVVRQEWAESVADVARRTRLGLGPCGGMRCVASCGRLVAEERGESPEWGLASAAAFAQSALRRRLPALGPEQARQEALAAAHLAADIGWIAAEPAARERS